jgi:hypothetical protein
VLSYDKTLLKAEFLKDDDPFPETTGNCIPSWTHVVFDASYNQSSKAILRLKSWNSWRTLLKVTDARDELVANQPHFLHGSEDSIDQDTYVVIKKMPSVDDCYYLTKGNSDDINLVTIKGTLPGAHHNELLH